MSNAVDTFAEPYRATLVEIVGADAPELLAALRETDAPSQDQKEALEQVLLNTFLSELGPDDEPSERGRRASRTIAMIYELWPNE